MVSLGPLNLDFIVQEVVRRVLQWGQLASSCFYFFEFLFFYSSENRGPISVCASYIHQNSQYYLQPFTTVFHMTLDLFLNWSTILQGCWMRPGKHNVGVEVIWEMSEAENKTSPHVAKCVCVVQVQEQETRSQLQHTAWGWEQSSFPVIHKVGNIVIFVQLLIEMNWKQLKAESVSTQIYVCHSTLNLNWSDSLLFAICFQI